MMNYVFDVFPLSTDILHGELEGEFSSLFLGISIGDDLVVHFSAPLDESQLKALDTIIEEHNPSPPIETIVGNIVESAAAFGTSLISEFAVDNILGGITSAGMTIPVALYLHRLDHYLRTGSLYAAMDEIDTMIADTEKEHLSPFLTDTKLSAYRVKISTYLGL